MASDAGAGTDLVIRVPVEPTFARLGIIEKREVIRWLDMSKPTFNKIENKFGIPFFRVGKKHYCRAMDLQTFIDSLAFEASMDADAEEAIRQLSSNVPGRRLDDVLLSKVG